MAQATKAESSTQTVSKVVTSSIPELPEKATETLQSELEPNSEQTGITNSGIQLVTIPDVPQDTEAQQEPTEQSEHDQASLADESTNPTDQEVNTTEGEQAENAVQRQAEASDSPNSLPNRNRK